MGMTEHETEIPADVMADFEEVCRQFASGGVRDPELLRRAGYSAVKHAPQVRSRIASASPTGRAR